MAFDPAEGIDHITGRIEFQNIRRGGAAIGFTAGCIGLHTLQRTRAMDDPDIIMRIDRNTDGLTDSPVMRKWLRPIRIGFEIGHHRVGRLGLGAADEMLTDERKTQAERGC